MFVCLSVCPRLVFFLDIVDDYKDDFDPTKSESYKAGLYAHIDEHLKQELANLCPTTLGALHQHACTDIISLYQQLLNLSQQQVSHYVLAPPEVNHVIHCSELCQDFREDLEFRFSLGLFSFTVRTYKVTLFIHTLIYLIEMD